MTRVNRSFSTKTKCCDRPQQEGGCGDLANNLRRVSGGGVEANIVPIVIAY
jgi:hypothetical protein